MASEAASLGLEVNWQKTEDLAQNRPLWSMMSRWHYTILELHARNDDDDLLFVFKPNVKSSTIFIYTPFASCSSIWQVIVGCDLCICQRLYSW